MRSYLEEKWRLPSIKLSLTIVGDPLPWQCEIPLFAKVGTKFRRQVAVDQSVKLACKLRVTEFFFVQLWMRKTNYCITHWAIVVSSVGTAAGYGLESSIGWKSMAVKKFFLLSDFDWSWGLFSLRSLLVWSDRAVKLNTRPRLVLRSRKN
jgi:hypothetical protein